MNNIPDTSITLIIPVLNEEKCLTTLIESIKRQTQAPEQIIVVDSKSTDGTKSVCESQSHIITYIVSQRCGIAHQRNYGAHSADSSILCFVDADVILPSDFISRIKRYYARSEHIHSHALFPIYLPISNHIFLLVLFFIQNVYCYIVQWFKPVWSGSTMIIPRLLFAQTSGFNSAVQFEDVEFAHRLSKTADIRMIPLVTRFSTRRFKEDGIIRITSLYLITSLLSLFGIHMPAHSVNYTFGEHS